MSFKELLTLALNAIKESSEDELTKENIRIAYIKSAEDNKFKMLSKDDVNGYIAELQ